jgi:hypothetical protein
MPLFSLIISPLFADADYYFIIIIIYFHFFLRHTPLASPLPLPLLLLRFHFDDAAMPPLLADDIIDDFILPFHFITLSTLIIGCFRCHYCHYCQIDYDIIAPLFDIAIFDYPTDPLTPIRHAIIAITPLRLLRAG